jgi:hypothetical protein
MATLIDTDGELVAETTTATFDDLVEENSTEEQVAPVAEDERVGEEERVSADDLPDKYQGKSAADIARMHQELEKRLGQQSSEVGSLRAAFDDLVRTSIHKQQSPTPEVEEVTESDFFADPIAAVRRELDMHPSVQRAEAAAVEMARNAGLSKLQKDHPDMKDILTSTPFQEWVGKSNFRSGLYKQADEQYDFDAASELLTLFKETNQVAKTVAKVEKTAQKQAVKNASTGTARSNPDGRTKGKIYRRVDIQQLLQTDPKRYDAMSDEILKAYAENRVK